MNAKMTRRNFLTYAGYGLLTATAGSTLLPKVAAAQGQKITLDDPIAVALGYVRNTPKPEQNCDNCLHAKGKPGDEWTPCALFQNKLVEKGAWCKAWVAK